MDVHANPQRQTNHVDARWLEGCADRLTAARRLESYALGSGFDLVAFLEPVDPSRDVDIVIWVVGNNRVLPLPQPPPLDSWPIAAQCIHTDEPFVWSPDDREMFGKHLGYKRRIAAQAFFRRFGVTAAITTPVHDACLRTGFVSWFTCTLRAPPLAEWRKMAPRLQRMAGEFLKLFPRLKAAHEAGTAPTLTGRELQCLRWTALGKSAEETAELIGRSAETVRFHLKNGARKLGAVNRVHAVALAAVHGVLGDLDDLM